MAENWLNYQEEASFLLILTISVEPIFQSARPMLWHTAFKGTLVPFLLIQIENMWLKDRPFCDAAHQKGDFATNQFTKTDKFMHEKSNGEWPFTSQNFEWFDQSLQRYLKIKLVELYWQDWSEFSCKVPFWCLVSIICRRVCITI